MISYYELLGMIKKGNNPEKVKYDNEMFVWCGGYYCNGDKGSYITDVMYEEDMFDKNIKIIDSDKKIEKLGDGDDFSLATQLDIIDKINEIIEVLNEKEKVQNNQK